MADRRHYALTSLAAECAEVGPGGLAFKTVENLLYQAGRSKIIGIGWMILDGRKRRIVWRRP
jgi:hypothetical protein